MTAAIWKSRSGDVPVTELNEFRLANAIAMVQRELNESTITATVAADKRTILTALVAEQTRRASAV